MYVLKSHNDPELNEANCHKSNVTGFRSGSWLGK